MGISVAAVAAESAARWPDQAAIIFEGEVLTCHELWLSARRFAAVLRERGVRAGDRVALLSSSTPQFAVACFAVLALGAVVVPIDPLLRVGEIDGILRDCGPVLLICTEQLSDQGRRSCADSRIPLFLLPDGVPAADMPDPSVSPLDDYVPREPGDIALVLYTSGTTGKAKGAMLTQLNITMNVTVTMESPFGFRPGDVLLGCLPLFHAFGLVCGMMTCLRAGATMVLMARFDPVRARELLAEHRCTIFMGVPTMYLALLETVATSGSAPRLDRAYSGGSALPVEVLEEFRQAFGCEVYEGYGLTETSPVVSYNQKGWPCRPGTVGRPIWGVEVRIARADLEGRIEFVPPGQVGEVVIRGHNVMAGYLNQPEATAHVLVDGWFRSGDLGMVDEDGYLSLVDRKKDMLLRNGYCVYPREVEDALRRHPAVEQVAVIGIPHRASGEEVWAVVIPRPGQVPDEGLAKDIIAWSRDVLAAYKYPRRVEFVGDFPLGPTGKILKRELVQRFHR
jgi:long-chain acyl-CoA synthetase